VLQKSPKIAIGHGEAAARGNPCIDACMDRRVALLLAMTDSLSIAMLRRSR
jgi:hypothetical protein